MQPHPNVRPRVDRSGQWLPPRIRGANILVQGDTSNMLFYYDPGQGLAYPRQDYPQDLIHYSDFSVYFYRDVFWCVPGDAIANAIGDWRSDDPQAGRASYQSQEETAGWHDWHLLTFAYGSNDYSSRVGIGHDNHTLYTQRPDQRWVPEIFPDVYHAPGPRRTQNVRFGGLSGDLGLLLALLAFSVSPEEVRTAVETCVRGDGWRPFLNAERRSGCKWFEHCIT